VSWDGVAQFSDAQIRRYSRQILLREVGGRGQARLLSARPALVAVGQLGQIVAEYLWRAGVLEPELYASTPEQAQALSRALAASGYGGRPARPLSAAPPDLRALACEAPEFTVLCLDHPDGPTEPLWACCHGSSVVVGEGADGLRAAGAHALQTPSGAGAMVGGSALALLALQRLLEIGPPVDRAAIWHVELDSPQLPRWDLPPDDSGSGAQRSR
jgi:hypothetical protein